MTSDELAIRAGITRHGVPKDVALRSVDRSVLLAPV